jgi:hypothetical protein
MPTTFAQTIDGNYIYAQRAVQDKNGDDIDQTYAKSASLATVATTGAYSDLSGTPTIVDNGKIYGMDGTESYNDIYTKMVVDGIGITWVLNRVSPYSGKATYTACEITSNDSTNTDGFLRLTCVMRAKTTSQQITVFIAEAWGNANGFGTPTYSLSSTPIGSLNQVYSWNSNGVAIARSINEVPPYTLPTDEGKVLTVGPSTTYWSTPAAGGVTDVEVDGVSVVSGGVASITTPTVDQVYNSASTHAQSGTAVAGAIAGINQVPASTSSDEGKVLTVDANGDPEWATGGGSQVQADWAESDSSEPSYIENKPVPKTLTAGTGISITENASTITIANTAPDLPIGSWEDVSTEAQYNTTPVLAGGFAIKYNAMLKLVSVTADVNLDAGAANIFTWSNRLKPVANAFALGNGLTLYVSQTSLNQPASATNRWVNGVWMWPVVGE